MRSLLVDYSFSPGLYDEIRIIHLEIYSDYNYILKFNWYKKYRDNEALDENNSKNYRQETVFNDVLPNRLKENLEALLSFHDFEIKTFYPPLTEEEKKQYAPLDVRHEDYQFYIEGIKFWVNVSPYIFKKQFLKTEQELLFGKFHENITEWLDEVYEKLIDRENI